MDNRDKIVMEVKTDLFISISLYIINVYLLLEFTEEFFDITMKYEEFTVFRHRI